ncbi:MAG: UDP-N-acetylglucosamine 2-epimerase [Bacilli bacterium]|nr:UDP-N-acetylglucosamine 2-epimerase [Bacilli bacterium]
MKKIVFITGTRADYGKIKSVIKMLDNSNTFDVYIYVTGMHLLEKYGSTYIEIQKDGFNNIFLSKRIDNSLSMDEILANNILQFTKFVKNIKPDMIFVHGDRVEAMAGAIVGALNNIYVSHIEGGEISGTIDESIRHAISKLANFHFVSNESSKKNLIQMGEDANNIFIVGSPDIDIMVKNNYDIDYIKKKYNINFENYAIMIYHPVISEIDFLKNKIKVLVDSIIESDRNYVVIYPNNDMGSDIILEEYKRLIGNDKIIMYPSIRFEYFLTLLKYSDFVIGNSSLGIRESGFYGIPTINVGTRQNGRYDLRTQKNICCVNEKKLEIINAINEIEKYKYKDKMFGNGDSDKRILKILECDKLWKRNIQKKFISIW